MNLRDHPGTVSRSRCRIVVFPPEVDISNADRLWADLRAALRPGVAVIIADMALTTFCDCSAGGLRE